ncbi:MAG TPA: sugar phosphate nucleotidyltransferase [Acidimicrobiales bacterium]|nr:sugar phosphate nucleotidyltransferase [Acidimicrobiales bacterium]
MVPRILLIVLAGGKGSRLDVLTVGRAKPSLPVGGTARLIDVTMSNAANSGLRDVWVVQQYEPHLLNDHLAGGRPWDLDRNQGGLRILPPYEGAEGEGFASGNADALARQARVIAAFDPEVVLVCSADHLFTLDLAAVADVHRERKAALTIVTTALARSQDPTRHALIDVDGRGRVTGIQDKPDDPPHRTAATEVFAYEPEALLGTLDDLRRSDEPLGDYGDGLVPALIETGRTYAFAHEGYWRDLGTPEAYLDSQLELLQPRSPLRLDDPRWPIVSPPVTRVPARIEASAHIDGAWISPGAVVRGTVVDAIIGPGTVVERGAEVRHCVLMADVKVGAGVSVARAVVADGAWIGAGARLGAPNARRPVLVGAGRRLAARSEVPSGAHLDPVDDTPLLG